MLTNPILTVPGYQFEATPDLSRFATRERLSQSAVDGFFAIMDKWRVPVERAGNLLGGMPRSSVYKLKTAAGTLRQDELTRISYIVGIYKALHILLPEDWQTGGSACRTTIRCSAAKRLSITWCARAFQDCTRFGVCWTQPAAAVSGSSGAGGLPRHSPLSS